MKILIIGHAYIAPINRLKWTVLANKYKDLELKILIPQRWPAALFKIFCGDLLNYNSKNCEFLSLKTFKSGNEILYGFSFLKLARILKNFKPDLIHVEQGDNSFVYFQTILLSKLMGLKAKFTFFTWVNWKAKRSLKYKLFWKFIENFNLKNSCGAIVGNLEAQNILREKKFLKPVKILLQLGVDEKVFTPVAPFDPSRRFAPRCFAPQGERTHDEKKIMPIDPIALRSEERASRRAGIKCTPKEKYIGYIGRITPEKGVFLLVDAFLKLREKYPEWRLLFVGDGPVKKDLINHVNNNKLKDRVDFIDSVSHEKIAPEIQKLEILVLPSYDTPGWKEQFGHVLIEAMACKIPIVGSDAGSIAQVVSEAGLIFEQKNTQGLVNCLEKLMSDENLRNVLGQKGFERFKSNFSYDIITKEIRDFWQKII